MRLAALVAICCLAVTALSGEKDPVKADLKRFQGKWQVVSRMLDGKPAKTESFAWKIVGNKIESGGGWYGVMTLDAKKTPRTYDLDYVHIGVKGKITPGEKGFRGIYAFAGDNTLKWCIAWKAGAPRPKAFESKMGDGNILYVLERVKE